MVSCHIVDVFSLDGSKKAVTLRATLSGGDKTLDGKLIQNCLDQLVKALGVANFPLKV